MSSWAFVAAGYVLTAAVLALYVGALHRRAARLRRRIRSLGRREAG
ncbi:MAG: hypothetical protein ACRD02_11255 [Acidimicrobiia bacterium]